MNPFVTRITPRHELWIWPVTAMSLVLGFMMYGAWINNSNRVSRFQYVDKTQQPRVSEQAIDINAFQGMTNEVSALRDQNTQLQNKLGAHDDASKLLNQQLQEAKLFGGLTPVEGPGVIVTLRDSSKGGLKVNDQVIYTPDTNIHDIDVLRIVNELFAAGAEAIAVNDHRIAGPSSIRCVGPTILVDDVKVASPIVVKAIGDPETMVGALNLNGGVLSEIRSSDPSMVEIEKDKSLKLDAYAGRTTFRLAVPPKETK